MSTRLHWQDFSFHRAGEPMPKAQHKDFPTREEAERAKRDMLAVAREDGRLVITITPSPAVAR
jgi:hypothetical protein